MTLKELRKQKKLTQKACAEYLGIPLRTFQNYETDEKKRTTIKYQYMMEKLEQYGYVDEGHGVLTTEKIRAICSEVFSEKEISYCYLFGSYAKGAATEGSDVDLLISTPISGMAFYDLVESLRDALHKKVDVVMREQLTNNPDLIDEILKYGVKIYE